MAQAMPPSSAPKDPQSTEDEGMMRSFVQTGAFKIPSPDYEVNEKAYLEYEDLRRGTFLVIIATEGRWNRDRQDIEYQLKLGDGTLYKNGEWVGEKTLKNS